MTSPFYRQQAAAKSRVVGLATDAAGARTTAYRAVAVDGVAGLTCARCERGIAPGELFSRQTQGAARQAVQNLSRAPVCATCRPLRLGVDSNTPGTASEEGRHG